MYAEGGLLDKSEYNEISVMDTSLDRQVPTPEVNNNYVKYSVMLPRGDTYSRGNFIGRKRDLYRNAIGRINYNPVLDTRKCLAEFDYVEFIKLTANLIAESIYYACDDSGN